MKRFNLLLINSRTSACSTLRNAVVKGLRKRFVFEEDNVAEAIALLNHLHIDILMLDLDQTPVDLAEMDRKYPGMMIYGIANRPEQFQSSNFQHKIFPRKDLDNVLKEELKILRKEYGLGLQKWFRLERSSSDDFRNFTRLVSAS